MKLALIAGHRDVTLDPGSRHLPSNLGPNSHRIQGLVDSRLLGDVALIVIGRNAINLQAEVDWQIISNGTAPKRIMSTPPHTDDNHHDALGDALCLAGLFCGGNGLVDHELAIDEMLARYRATSQTDHRYRSQPGTILCHDDLTIE